MSKSWMGAGMGEQGVQDLDGLGRRQGVTKSWTGQAQERASKTWTGASKIWTVSGAVRGQAQESEAGCPNFGRCCRRSKGTVRGLDAFVGEGKQPRTIQGLDAFVEGAKPSKAWTLLSREPGSQTVRGLDAFIAGRTRLGRFCQGGQGRQGPSEAWTLLSWEAGASKSWTGGASKIWTVLPPVKQNRPSLGRF